MIFLKKRWSTRTTLYRISAMPPSILQFFNFNDPYFYPHIYIRSMMFTRIFWGMHWSVGNSHAAVGAWYHLHLASYLFQYTSRWPLLSKKSRTLLDTHRLNHEMPGFVVQRQDYAKLRVHLSIVYKYPLTTPC